MAAAAALAGLLLLVLLLPAHQALETAAGDAHPGYAGAEADTCGPALGGSSSSGGGGGGAAGRRYGRGLEEYGGGRIVDITHAYRRGLPPDATVGPLVRLKESMENGSDYNLSELRMHCHMGTHVDAPGHMNQDHFAAGLDVDTLDLDVLNEPTCQLVDEGAVMLQQLFNDICGGPAAAMMVRHGSDESMAALWWRLCSDGSCGSPAWLRRRFRVWRWRMLSGDNLVVVMVLWWW